MGKNDNFDSEGMTADEGLRVGLISHTSKRNPRRATVTASTSDGRGRACFGVELRLLVAKERKGTKRQTKESLPFSDVE